MRNRQWAGSFSLIGQASIDFLQEIYLDKVFVSVCGIDAVRGITLIEPEEALTFRAMIRQAKKTVVVADSSKPGVVAPARICPHFLDSHADHRYRDREDALAPFLEQGIEVRKV